MSAADTILRHVYRRLGADRSDPDLLRAYVERRCDDAFRALVARHGPAVLGVCRRHLGDLHAAEDAFQATFLLLARSAPAIRQPEALSAWLYRTAMRVCGRARLARDRRRAGEANALPRTVADPAAELSARELLATLDTELDRLPERYRLPLALVYWQGLTHVEAGRRLGLTPGALHGRLDRGRARLTARLKRRGFAPCALLVAPLAAATVPSDLLAATVTIAADPWSKALPAAVLAVAAASATGKLAAVSGLCVTLVGFGLFGLAAQSPSPIAPQKAAKALPAIAAAPSVDRFGDALPPGAMARLGTIRMRHADAQRVVPLPDGKSLISFGSGPTARVWDLATGRLLREFGPFPPIWIQTNANISPDGRWLAVPNQQASQVWDVGAGRLAYTATDDGWMPCAYAFGPDSRLLASGSSDGQVRFRDALTGKLLRLGAKHQGRVTGLVFRDQDTLISAGEDGTVRIWDVTTATVRHEFKTRQQPVTALALTSGGTLLATASSSDPKVRLWEMPAGREIANFDTKPTHGLACPLAFSPDGKTLAAGGAGSENSDIQLWDVATRRERKLPFGREMPSGRRVGGLWNLAFSPDGQTLFAPDNRQVIHCLDVTTGRDRFANDEPAGPVGAVSFTADSRNILTSCLDEFIRTYDLTGRMIKRQPAGYATAFAPGGHVAFTSASEEWWLMDPETGRTWGRTKTAPHGILAVEFAPNGQTVAVFTSVPKKGRALQLHETATGRLLRTFEEAAFGVVLKFTPDGKSLALVERDGLDIIHLWDAATGRTTERMRVPPDWYCRDIAFSPDGRLVAVPRLEPRPAEQMGKGGPPKAASVAILEVATGRECQRLRLEATERPNEVFSIRFTPDGRSLMLCLEDGSVRQWELASGRERVRFATNSGTVTALAISPDRRLLASGNGASMRDGGSGEGSVLLWRLPLSRERPAGPLPTDRIGRDALWSELGNPEAALAWHAMNRLAADAGGALAVIQEGLAAAAPSAEHLQQLIADLDSPKFDARTKAFAELERLSDRAEEALRQVLAGKPSTEVRAQVARLLKKLESQGEPPEVLRAIRAVEVLEMIDTAEARRMLLEFAKGDPAARLTREAQASVVRLRGSR